MIEEKYGTRMDTKVPSPPFDMLRVNSGGDLL
jgi:hypothetical protein